MSVFEISSLFATHVTMVVNIFMAFVSITSALLVATYFAGHIITLTLTRVVITIYVTSSIFPITTFQRTADVLINIRAEFDKTMSWHTAASEPAWILPMAAGVGTFTLVAISAGSIWYFFEVRKDIRQRSVAKNSTA